MTVAVLSHLRLIPGPILLLGAENDPTGSLFVVIEDLEKAQIQRDGTYLVRDFDASIEEDARWITMSAIQLAQAKSLLQSAPIVEPEEMFQGAVVALSNLIESFPGQEPEVDPEQNQQATEED